MLYKACRYSTKYLALSLLVKWSDRQFSTNFFHDALYSCAVGGKRLICKTNYIKQNKMMIFWTVFVWQLPQTSVSGITGSWASLFASTPWINNSFQADLYKRWLLAAGPACPLTVSWLNPPDSHCSITVHPSGRGHGRQLSHSLQIKSMSDPSWASCPQGAALTWQELPSVASPRLLASCPLCMCARVSVWTQRNRIKRGLLSPTGAFHLVLYVIWQN